MKLDAKKAHESLLIADSILEEASNRRLHTSELEALKKHLKLLHKYFDMEMSK